MVSYQGGLSSWWSLHQGGLLSVWSFIRVVSHLEFQFAMSLFNEA